MGVEVFGGSHHIILIPLQVVHETTATVGGRGGACAVTQGIVKVNRDDASLRV